MEKVEYGGWANCVRLANDVVELIATGDVGPRIIRFGFLGGGNEFKEFDEMLGRTGDDEWLIYGGHRLWHAPEEKPRTYYPDNNPVHIEVPAPGASVLHIRQDVEPTTGIEKDMKVVLPADNTAHVLVKHRLRNRGSWPVELAPWALTVLAQGGRVVVPLPPRGSHEENLLPANTLTMWPYTNMSDPRWTWGERFILLGQDPEATCPQKVGVMVPSGWAAYARDGHLFVKTFTYQRGAAYPDWGCSVETFTNNEMIELETVGPLTTLAPGESVDHVEDWYLFDGVPVPQNDGDVEKHVMPKVLSVLPAENR